MPRFYGNPPDSRVIPGYDDGLSVRLNDGQPEQAQEVIETAGPCVSNITGVNWFDASSQSVGTNPTSLGVYVERDTFDTNHRPLGPFALIGMPVGDICPDCVLDWQLTTSPVGYTLYWIDAGRGIYVSEALATGFVSATAVTEGTYIWTLSVNCPDSGQSGVVGTLELLILPPEGPD